MAGFVRLAGGRAAGVTSMAARMHNPTRVLRRLRGGRRVQMCEAKGRSCCMSNSRVAFPCAGEHLVRLNSYLQRIYMFHRHPTSRDSTSANHLRSTPTKRPSAKLRSPRHYVLMKRLPTKLSPCETTTLRNYHPAKLPPYETTQGMLYFCLRPQILRQDQALPSLNEVRSAAEQARYLHQVRLHSRRPRSPVTHLRTSSAHSFRSASPKRSSSKSRPNFVHSLRPRPRRCHLPPPPLACSKSPSRRVRRPCVPAKDGGHAEADGEVRYPVPRAHFTRD